MANTFFGFNTNLNDDSEDRLGSSPEDIEGLEAEEEYDALNDETFGGLGGEDELDDWEVQHEQLAEITENSRHSNHIESFLDHLGLNEDHNDENENENKSSDKSSYNDTIITNGRGNSSNQQPLCTLPSTTKLRTVEELERMLINQSIKPPPPQQNVPHGSRFPPGYQPMVLPSTGGQAPIWYPHHPPPPHPGLVRMMGPPPPGVRIPPPHLVPPPGFMYAHHSHHHQHHPHHQGFPQALPPAGPPPPSSHPPHHFNMLAGNLMSHSVSGLNLNRSPGQRQRTTTGHYNQQQYNEPKDEYAGLMNNREKQWLLNIQLLQVNTGTPYFDDYYYTVFKERQVKNKDNVPEHRNNQQQQQRYQNNRQQQHTRDGNVSHHQQHHHHNNRQQQQQQQDMNPLNKKVYTPLQFENSLGKLQFGSVTAPRKIIDMDIITMEKESDSITNTRDTRKTKQLLIELETMYTLILKVEDLKNPVAISNREKLIELKQKQRLREIDAAPTPEQKQEILKLLQQESSVPVENQKDLLNRIVHTLLQDDKLTSFVAIRKGKMLLLRVLPHLSIDTYLIQLLDLWTKLLLSLALIGRRDTMGDNILPQFHPHFKRFANAANFDQILEIFSNLFEVIKLENSNRSTPLSHQNKSPLYFVLSNKFGLSCVCLMIQRVSTSILLTPTWNEKQVSEWSGALVTVTETLERLNTTMSTTTSVQLPTPIEFLSEQCINTMLDKYSEQFSQSKRMLLIKTFTNH